MSVPSHESTRSNKDGNKRGVTVAYFGMGAHQQNRLTNTAVCLHRL